MDNPAGKSVQLKTPFAMLEGVLNVPPNSQSIGLLVFGRHNRSPVSYQTLARKLAEGGVATLMIALLTVDEGAVETGHFQSDVDLLANRVIAATDWLAEQPATQPLRVGYVGLDAGAGAALVAAAERPERVGAVVSCGGQPDAASDSLARVEAATLLIVGGSDALAIRQNQDALARLRSKKQLEIVPGVAQLFDEPDAVEAVAKLTLEWFRKYL